MEGAHGELRTRLADRLRSDHTDGFADVDRRTAAEIAAVTLGAQAIACVAGQRRAHLDFVDAELVDQVTEIFIDQRAGFDHRRIAFRADHIDDRDATEDTFAQGFDSFAALDQRFHRRRFRCCSHLR